jgi:hypothetical protein
MTHALFILALYLFIGSLVMLLANELIDGALTEQEFVRGMICWPAVVVWFCGHVLLAIVRKALSRG